MAESETGSPQSRPPTRNPLADLDLTRLCEGDATTWKRFLELTHGIVQAAGFKVGLRSEEREELAQTTYIICFQAIHKLREPGSTGTWVYRVAYRQALKIAQDRSPGMPSGETADWILERFASDAPNEDDVLERNERSLQLRQAIAGLGEPCTGLLQVLYLQESVPSYEEVSESLSMPIGSIGPTRARCLDRAKKQLENVSEEGQFATQGKRSSGDEPGRAH